MNITRLVTGPLSVNTWCIPLDAQRMMIVDPGGDADIIIAHLSEQHAVPSLIFLTPGHLDHVMGLPDLVRAFPGIPVAIHPGDALFLGKGSLDYHRAFFGASGGLSFARSFREDLPPSTFLLEDGIPVALPSWGTIPPYLVEGWTVLHTPGHSKGSVCLYNASEKVLVAGDTLFNAGFGRTDFPGSSMEDMERSLVRLSKLPPETEVLPGHGQKTTIGRELA